jgi:ubiquinone/menaquinone biosynthesis C-methylase UbiE
MLRDLPGPGRKESRLDHQFIKKHWDHNAEKYGGSHWASWGDNFAVDLEVETIARYINEGARVLDVGCASGFSTISQFRRREGKIRITGIDYSEGMIRGAEAARIEQDIGASVDFRVGNVMNIEFPEATFDVVYTTRVLINLPTWEEQQVGLENCLRVAKRGGVVIISEAFWEPLNLLNSLRALKQLPLLVEHDFNRYLKKTVLEAWLKQRGLKFENVDFSSIYYLGSRFLRELVTNPADYPGYSNPINKLFYEIEREFSGGGFGIQQAYVIYK